MRVIPPLYIVDGILTGTTIVEAYPTVAWSSATTYALNDVVYIAGPALLRTAYRSLQATNLNHNPTTSPTWWVNVGAMYPEYAGGTTYALADRVMVSSTHLIYESLVASNLGNAVSDVTKWLLIGPTNRWAMFDTLRSTKSEMGSPLQVIIQPNQGIDSIAFLGIVANSAIIEITSSSVVVYSATITFNNKTAADWQDYFFNQFPFGQSAVLLNIPSYSNMIINIIFTKTYGLVKVGNIIIGRNYFIGDTQFGAESDVLNFSTVTRNFAGDVVKFTQRRNVPKTIQTVWIDKSLLDTPVLMRDLLNGTTAVWLGIDDSTDTYFSPLLILGFYTRFMIKIADFSKAIIDIELQEI